MDNITIKVGIYFLLSFAYLLWYHQYIYIYIYFSIVIWLLIVINNQQSFGYPFFVSPRHWFLCEPGRLWAAGQPWLVLRIISSIWDMMCVVILKLISHIPYIDCSNTTYIYILRYNIYIYIYTYPFHIVFSNVALLHSDPLPCVFFRFSCAGERPVAVHNGKDHGSCQECGMILESLKHIPSGYLTAMENHHFQ